MSGWLIGLVGVIYLGVAASEYRDGNTGMALTFVGYAVANVGLIRAGARL